MKIAVWVEAPVPETLQKEFQNVASSLQIETTNEKPAGSYFKYDSKGLHLFDEELGHLHLDFLNDQANYARSAHRGKSELIAKACGLPKGCKKIFDATIGLAQDAWFLARLGAQVEGCERSPVIFLLLKDALIRSGQENLKIHYGDSIQWLQKVNTEEPFDTVYMDPMFPEKKKSALPRKEMRIFRKWVGDDADSLTLFETAMHSGAERVVVKRPIKAPDLISGVAHSFAGQTVRYDLYSPLRLKGS